MILIASEFCERAPFWILPIRPSFDWRALLRAFSAFINAFVV